MAAVSRDGSERIFDGPLWQSLPEKLGFTKNELRRLGRLLVLDGGLVLVASPSGNGRSTTLYSALRWSQTLRPADPGVVLVGEIREREAARLALDVRNVKQLVLSTVQADSAAMAIMRLLDLGWDAVALAAALRGVIAQRLLRRPCASCVDVIPFEELSIADRAILGDRRVDSVAFARGCAECDGVGYNGQVLVAEIAYITPVVRCAIARGSDTHEIANLCRLSGMKRLRDAAFDRVALHQTTLEEVTAAFGGQSTADGDVVKELDAKPVEGAALRARRATDHGRIAAVVGETPVQTHIARPAKTA